MTFREFEGKNAVTETIGDQAASLLGALNMPMVNKHKIDTTSSFVAHLVYIF